LISHHPPHGILDEWGGQNKGSKRIGGYLQFLQQVQKVPSVHVFGHVHQLGKSTPSIQAHVQKTTFVNVAQSVAFLDYYFH